MKSYQLEAERILYSLGVTRKYRGFDFAIAAILSRIQSDLSPLPLPRGSIYAAAAAPFHSSPRCVSQNIRTLLRHAWLTNPQRLADLTHSSTAGPPSPSHFIECIAALLLRSLPGPPEAAPPLLPPSRQHNGETDEGLLCALSPAHEPLPPLNDEQLVLLSPILSRLGISSSYAGYPCLLLAVRLSLLWDLSPVPVSSSLYAAIADRLGGIKPSAVESALRTVTRRAWRQDAPFLQHLARRPLDRSPTVSQFVQILSAHLQRALSSSRPGPGPHLQAVSASAPSPAPPNPSNPSDSSGPSAI